MSQEFVIYVFREALYTALEAAPDIRTVTPSEVLAKTPPTA